jgi:hypothetical protein
METTMKISRATLIVASLLVAFASRAKADDVTLTLDPLGGAISGAAGTTVGWGFTLDSPTDYAFVDYTDFCVGAPSSPCSNSLGMYTDFAGPNFVDAGPAPYESPSVSESFDNSSSSGIGSFAINPGATGSVDGEIVLVYDLYSLDYTNPNFDPVADLISSGNILTATASVTVGSSSVPEPGALSLLAIGFAACLLATKFRREMASDRRLR